MRKLGLAEMNAFVAVAQGLSFAKAAQQLGMSRSSLSETIRGLEERFGVRLLNRTTRSVVPTEAGTRLIERLLPALDEVELALDVVNAFRDRPAGTLRINVPANVARTVLPPIVTPFLKAYPDIKMEVVVEDSFVDIIAEGCDAGIRYDERLEQDMIAMPIGPRTQRLATAAAPLYIDARGRPGHPRDLLDHVCVSGRFSGGAKPSWDFECGGETMRLSPNAQLVVRQAAAFDLAVQAAVDGLGIIHLFEDWLAPYFASGALVPLLEPWWESFPGPFLYYPSRRHQPTPLRAFIDFVRQQQAG